MNINVTPSRKVNTHMVLKISTENTAQGHSTEPVCGPGSVREGGQPSEWNSFLTEDQTEFHNWTS